MTEDEVRRLVLNEMQRYKIDTTQYRQCTYSSPNGKDRFHRIAFTTPEALVVGIVKSQDDIILELV